LRAIALPTLESQADGALHAVWSGKSKAWMEMGAEKPSDISREANDAMMLSLTVRVNAAPTTDVRLGIGSGSLPLTAELRAVPAGSYAILAVPLKCFSSQDLTRTPTILLWKLLGISICRCQISGSRRPERALVAPCHENLGQL
jgi:beta-glucosidase